MGREKLADEQNTCARLVKSLTQVLISDAHTMFIVLAGGGMCCHSGDQP
jgi:hypothetical protein